MIASTNKAGTMAWLLVSRKSTDGKSSQSSVKFSSFFSRESLFVNAFNLLKSRRGAQHFTCFLTSIFLFPFFETRADDVSCGLIHILTFSKEPQVHEPLFPPSFNYSLQLPQDKGVTRHRFETRSDHADRVSSS